MVLVFFFWRELNDSLVHLIMIESEMSILENTFDLSQFDEYREETEEK